MKDTKNKTTTTNGEAEPAIDRAFLSIITAHKQGREISEISAALKQVTAGVQLTGRAGKVTLEMSLRPASKGSTETLIFETKIKAKVPESDVPGSIFYADEDFNLVRNDPNQTELQLRTVEQAQGQQPPAALRKAGDQ